MSKSRNYSEQTIGVMVRFYEALDAIKDNKTIRGTATYCTRHNIDRRHLIAQRKDLGKGYFEVSWIVPMVTDYGISANWLLTGKGAMMKKKAAVTPPLVK